MFSFKSRSFVFLFGFNIPEKNWGDFGLNQRESINRDIKQWTCFHGDKQSCNDDIAQISWHHGVKNRANQAIFCRHARFHCLQATGYVFCRASCEPSKGFDESRTIWFQGSNKDDRKDVVFAKYMFCVFDSTQDFLWIIQAFNDIKRCFYCKGFADPLHHVLRAVKHKIPKQSCNSDPKWVFQELEWGFTA